MKKSIFLYILTSITAINLSCNSDKQSKSLSETAREQSISETKRTLIEKLGYYDEMISYFHLSIDEWIGQHPKELMPAGKPSSIAMHIDSSTVKAKIEESIFSMSLNQSIGDDYSRLSLRRDVIPDWWNSSRMFITDPNSFITALNYEKLFFHDNTTEDYKCSVFDHHKIHSTKPVDSIMVSVTCMIPVKITEVEIKKGEPFHHFHNGGIYLDSTGSLYITQSLLTLSCGIYGLNKNNQIIYPSEGVNYEGLDIIIDNYKKIQSIIQDIEAGKYNNSLELAKDIETLSEVLSLSKSFNLFNLDKPNGINKITWDEEDSISKIVLLTGTEYLKKDYKINVKNNLISNLGYQYISEASQQEDLSGLYLKIVGSDGTIVINKHFPDCYSIEQYSPYFFSVSDCGYLFDELTLDLKPVPYHIEEAVSQDFAIVSQMYKSEYENYIKVYGVLDKTGELIIPIEFTYIKPNGSNLLYCKKFKDYLIDHQKRTITTSNSNEHNYFVKNLKGESLFSEGLDLSYGIEIDEETIFIPEDYYGNYHYQVFNSNGTPFLDKMIVSGMDYWLDGILQVWDNSSTYFINKQKQKVFDVSKYKTISIDPCGYIIITDKNEHMGLYDTKGKLRLPFDYSYISEPMFNISLVIKDGPEGKQCALVNMENQPLSPFEPYISHDIKSFDYSCTYSINNKNYNIFGGEINK